MGNNGHFSQWRQGSSGASQGSTREDKNGDGLTPLTSACVVPSGSPGGLLCLQDTGVEGPLVLCRGPFYVLISTVFWLDI